MADTKQVDWRQIADGIRKRNMALSDGLRTTFEPLVTALTLTRDENGFLGEDSRCIGCEYAFAEKYNEGCPIGAALLALDALPKVGESTSLDKS